MTYQLSRWSVLALFPALALTCTPDGSIDLGEGDTGEADTEEFVEFRADPLKTLTGSKFEIDASANLTLESVVPGWKDWKTVSETRSVDAITGQHDTSYTGAKEDDPCPSIGEGSIPNNKSDIKQFGVYQEAGSPGFPSGFLHLFWSRVQDPKGTTLIDFEFNQSPSVCPPQGQFVSDHKLRTPGDLLIEYALAKGGSSATITMRTWVITGNQAAWSSAEDLTVKNLAAGTINIDKTAIDDGPGPDGLGSLSQNTFGEASISLDAIFEGTDKCISFGSAKVKSRSADAFDSALKDFAPTVAVQITNCGRVTIQKETIGGNLSEDFGFTHTLKTDSAPSTEFALKGGHAQSFTNVLFNEPNAQYSVTEDELDPTRFKLVDIDCSASSGVTFGPGAIDLATQTVSFAIDQESDIVDCTFKNQHIPRTDITVSVNSHDDKKDGGTSSTIKCDKAMPNPISWDLVNTNVDTGDGSLAINDLLAGTYTCVVVINPP